MKKVISIILCFVFVISSLPNLYIISNAGSLTQSEFNSKISSAKSLYPTGSSGKSEWNIDGRLAYECFGFALWLSSYVWGKGYMDNRGSGANQWSIIEATSSDSKLSQLKPGDVCRYNNAGVKHSIFILNIKGSTIYYCDANGKDGYGYNIICWERSISISSLGEKMKNSFSGEITNRGYIARYNSNTLVGGSSSVNTYRFVYYANGGTGSMDTVNVQHGSKITFAKNKFTRKGYTFKGWNVYRNSDSAWITSGGHGFQKRADIEANGYTINLFPDQWSGTVDNSWVNGTVSNGSMYTLYAVWQPNTYRITYYANGGSGSIASTYTQQDEKITFPKNTFTRPGYKFLGWNVYRSSDSAWITSGGHGFQKRADIEANGYEIHLFPEQWSGTLDSSWINGTVSNGSMFMLYAVWQPNTYKVNYYGNGGSGSMESTTTQQDAAITFPENQFTRPGYKFAGWYLYRSSDATWMTSNGHGFMKYVDIEANGYEAHVFPEGWTGTVDSSWVNWTVSNGSMFMLYAVWQPNTCKILNFSHSGKLTVKSDTAEYSVTSSNGEFALEGIEDSTYRVYFTANNSLTVYAGEYSLGESEDIELSLENPEVVVGDFNKDNVVDLADLSLLLSSQIYGTENSEYDITEDGYVDAIDISKILMSTNYGKSGAKII